MASLEDHDHAHIRFTRILVVIGWYDAFFLPPAILQMAGTMVFGRFLCKSRACRM